MNVLKHGPRARMLPIARQLCPAALELQGSMAASSNALSRWPPLFKLYQVNTTYAALWTACHECSYWHRL